jgi:anti-anti-sigma factor
LETFVMPYPPFSGAVKLFISGDIDGGVADEFRDAVVVYAGQGTVAVVLDLEEVTFFSSAGISALLAARRILLEHDIVLCIDDCSEIVETLLQTTGVRAHFARSDAVGVPGRPDRPGPG